MKSIKIFFKIFHVSFGFFFCFYLLYLQEINYAIAAAILSILILIDDVKKWNR